MKGRAKKEQAQALEKSRIMLSKNGEDSKKEYGHSCRSQLYLSRMSQNL